MLEMTITNQHFVTKHIMSGSDLTT